MAALLAVGVGCLASAKRPALTAAVVVSGLVVAYALELRSMVEQFFRDYLFL